MGILLNLMLAIAVIGLPLLFLAAFIHFFSSYRKLKKEVTANDASLPVKRYLGFAIFFGVLFFVFSVLSAYYVFLIFSGNILM